MKEPRRFLFLYLSFFYRIHTKYVCVLHKYGAIVFCPYGTGKKKREKHFLGAHFKRKREIILYRRRAGPPLISIPI